MDNMTTRLRFTLPALLLLLAAIASCRDNPSSGGSGGRAPELPDIHHFLLDPLSYFEVDFDPETDADTVSDYSGFLAARDRADLLALSGFGTIYLDTAEGTEPVAEGGLWVWEYTLAQDDEDDWGDWDDGEFEAASKNAAGKIGIRSYRAQSYETIHCRLTARTLSGGTEWILRLSGYMDGEAFDLLFMEGRISADGSGSWSYYDAVPGENRVLLESEWEFHSPSRLTYRLDSWFGIAGVPGTGEPSASNQPESIEYEMEGPENWIKTGDGEDIYWNGETGYGWVFRDGKRSCFDRNADFKDVPCLD